MTGAMSLAPGVTLDSSRAVLVDAVRGQSVPLNQTACYMLYSAQGRSLGETTETIASETRTDIQIVRRDLEALCDKLNSKALVNVGGRQSHMLRAWLPLALKSVRHGIIPSAPPILIVRRPVDTSTTRSIILTTAAAGIRNAFSWALSVVGVLLAALLVGAEPATFYRQLTILAVAPAIGASLLIHEIGHALFLRNVPTVLVTRGPQIFLLHRPIQSQRAVLVSAAGPVISGIVGGSLLIVAYLITAPVLLLVALPFVVQLLGLTVLAHDGRHLLGLRPAESSKLKQHQPTSRPPD